MKLRTPLSYAGITLLDAGGLIVCDAEHSEFSLEDDDRNMSEIAVAVNSHEALVKALEDVPLPSTNAGSSDWYNRFYTWYYNVAKPALAAIPKGGDS